MRTMTVGFAAAAALVGVLGGSSIAEAQQFGGTFGGGGSARRGERAQYFEQRVAAPKNAVELSVGTGYTQGFGMLEQGVGMPSVATPGLGIDVGAGWRINPNWSLNVDGQYQELTPERADATRGITQGFSGTYHFAPYVRTDPWVQFGTGYRVLWETHATSATLVSHGPELVKATAGLDFRFDRDVAIAPLVGADLDLFMFQNGAGSTAIADPRPSGFVYAGIQGRFDVGAAMHDTETTPTTTARR